MSYKEGFDRDAEYDLRPIEEPYDGEPEYCTHEGRSSWAEYDARGIYLCRVCDYCEKTKLRGYRPEVLTDSDYDHDEPISDEHFDY